MRKFTPKVVQCRGSETSKHVVEGLRVNGKRTRKFFVKRRAAETWLRKTQATAPPAERYAREPLETVLELLRMSVPGARQSEDSRFSKPASFFWAQTDFNRPKKRRRLMAF
jgi:hypothetical protein